MGAQIAVLVWLVVSIPWLYSVYGSQRDWWVFVLAMAVFLLPLLGMIWYAIRRWRAFKERSKR